MTMKRIAIWLCAGALCLALCACGKQETASPTVPVTGSSAAVDTDNLFSDRDADPGYTTAGAVAVTLNGSTVTADSPLVAVSGTTVTLTGEGTFILSGTLEGSVVVDAPKTAKLQLVLDNAHIRSDTGCALYVKQADKVFVTLATGSENTLTGEGEYVQTDDNNVDAALFSKEDLTLNGDGALTVTAAFGHGIVSKDDLTITGGSLAVTAPSHGLAGKDCVKIGGGTLTVTAGKDGIHSENSDDASLGYVYVGGGTVTVTAENDGISAQSALQIDGGTLSLTTGGGSANASWSQGGGFGGGWGTWGSGNDTAASAKGLKAGETLIINGGTFALDTSDDAIHCNGSVTVNGGTLTLTSGDDGIHADDDLLLAGGTLTIEKSYEGAEAQRIAVTGGVITVVASDDGFNSAGGNDGSALGGRPGQGSFGAESDASLTFAGGTVTVNADGDGLDSNGDLTVTGGTIRVSGPTNSGNGALDNGGNAVITGGTLVATGAAGMAENFGRSSTQGSLLYSFSSTLSAGEALTLTDENGAVLVSYTPEKTYSSVVISVPELESGSTYTLTVGDRAEEFTLSSLVWSNGSSFGGGFGGGHGGPGGFGR